MRFGAHSPLPSPAAAYGEASYPHTPKEGVDLRGPSQAALASPYGHHMRVFLVDDSTLVRVRLSHNGALKTEENPDGWLPGYFFERAKTLGGAMIDLGCHPMYLTRYFLGLPESVSAHYGYITRREVEDNAVVVLNYPQGALGIVEAGFVNRHSPFTIEIHGTEGSLFYGTPEAKLLVRSALMGTGADQQWQEISVLPADRPLAFDQWIEHIQQGTNATENIQMARDLTGLMEAANRSAERHEVVQLTH